MNLCLTTSDGVDKLKNRPKKWTEQKLKNHENCSKVRQDPESFNPLNYNRKSGKTEI